MEGVFNKPEIEILELKEDSIKFLLTKTDTSVANALRRTMIGKRRLCFGALEYRSIFALLSCS